MSTHASVAMCQPDGSVKSVYVHFDGYPAYVGKILLDHYSDENKLTALLDLGSISCLGPEIGSSNSFENPDSRFCLFYGRDRGEKNTAARTHIDVDDFLTNDTFYTNYRYVYSDGKWRCFKSDGEELDLSEAIGQSVQLC